GERFRGATSRQGPRRRLRATRLHARSGAAIRYVQIRNYALTDVVDSLRTAPPGCSRDNPHTAHHPRPFQSIAVAPIQEISAWTFGVGVNGAWTIRCDKTARYASLQALSPCRDTRARAERLQREGGCR